MELIVGSLYRITIPDGGSGYWKVIDIGGDGVLWACLAVGRRHERIVTLDDVITESVDKALVGKKVAYTVFSR